jgi:CBS domain-containing protein
MAAFRGIELAEAAVPRGVTFGEAAAMLTAHPVSAVAVLDDDGRVVGVFGSDQLLSGIFPRYLRELRHTAFAKDDDELLGRWLREHRDEPIGDHMHAPVTLDEDASATHAAEVFLHCELDALPVVRNERFLGMLGRSEFCRAMLEDTR